MGSLTADEIARLRSMRKPVRPQWRDKLLKDLGRDDQRRITILDLDSGPTRGTLEVYARQGRMEEDFSAGLVLMDHGGRSATLVRVNGPHSGGHENRWPKRHRLPVGPHVHYLTGLYLDAHERTGRKPYPDGYALPATAYRDLPGALEALARRTNIDDGYQMTTESPWPYVRSLP